MPSPVYNWLALFVLFGIVEAATVSLTSIWFAIGSLAALAAALFGAQVWLQVVVFLVVTVLTVLLTRPLVRRFVDPKKTPTNIGRLLGQQAEVTEAIDNLAGRGAVYLDGKTWSARSADGAPIPAGRRITVQSIEGVKLIVRLEEKVNGAVS